MCQQYSAVHQPLRCELRMTIAYRIGLRKNWLLILGRWKGSVWRAVSIETAVWLFLYYLVMVIYRLALTDDQMLGFEHFILFINKRMSSIPMTFLLGFYVSTIVTRWWNQFLAIPFPEDALHNVNAIITGTQEDQVIKRRCVARWMVLAACLTFREISLEIRKRFPTLDHIVKSGLMSESEKNAYLTATDCVRWYLPLQWAQRMVENDVRHGKTDKTNVGSVQSGFYNQLNKYRRDLLLLFKHDSVPIPMGYTQVVALTIYGYFIMALFGFQFIVDGSDLKKENDYSMYFPLFALVQFIFYIGWFKVGLSLIRPFGQDDDDIELSFILDRHLQSAMAMVDSTYEQEIYPQEDPFMSEKTPMLDYTKEAAKYVNVPKLQVVVEVNESNVAKYEQGQKREVKQSDRPF